jgi:hypothetical protein
MKVRRDDRLNREIFSRPRSTSSGQALWDYSDLCKPTQDHVLGPSLRDRAAEAFPFIERLPASVATADVGQISKVAGELF